MLRILVFAIVAMTASAAEDAWEKVRALKSGTELRIYKKGSTQPLLAQAGEATEDSLIIAVKNEQMAIPKDQINRIDYRPVRPRLTNETRQEVKGTSSSTTSGVSIQGKADFETIYRRTPPPPAKK